MPIQYIDILRFIPRRRGSSNLRLGPEAEEAADWLTQVREHRQISVFQAKLQWRDRSIASRDNHATWHCAYTDCHGHRREKHPITIEGTALG